MANKNKAFNTKQTNFNDYMARLEDLLRKNRGSASYQGYDVNPNAQLVPGKVKDPTGLGDQQYSQDLKYENYVPQSTGFKAPNVGQIAPYNEPQGDYGLGADNQPTPNVSATDFFDQVAQAIYAPKLPSQQSTQELEQIYNQTGQKYAVQQLETGEVRYNDGSVGIEQQQEPASPIASMSDGNVLWSDGWVRPQMPDYMQGSGVEALSQGLFGSNQFVTQPFGRYNPIEPTPGNINVGTDFRTRNLQTREVRNLFSEPLEVVEIYNQAQPGSGRVGDMTNRGYGNSILLRRGDGSMMRVSHFDNLGQFGVGDMIQPGQVIGTPGSTGNVTGEHADVELYSIDGKIVSPDSFMASVRESAGSQEKLYQPGKPQMSVDPQQQQQEQPRMITDRINEAREYAKQLAPQQVAQQAQQAVQPGSPQREALGNIPEEYAQNLGIQFEAGAGEGIEQGPEAAKQARISAVSQQPKVPMRERGLFGKFRQLAGNVSERIGDTLGIPEGGWSEAIAQGPTKRTGQAMASQIGGEKPEAIPGIRENLSDIGRTITGGDPFRRAGEVVQQAGQKAGEAIRTGTENLIGSTKDAFGKLQAPGIMQKPSTLDLDPNAKQVGEVSSQQQNMSAAPVMSKDTRDPFFKYGGSQDFAGQLKPGAEEMFGGALDTGIFKEEFYQNPKAVGTVFGGTHLGTDATSKYKDYLQSQIKPGFDQPFREEVRGDWKYRTPVREYWENKHWQDQLSQTPEKLTGDFSYKEFEAPETKRQAFKGERQTIAGDGPTFKSNAASLFAQAGDRAGQFVKGIGNKLASIYQPHPFSKTVAMPEKIRSEVGEQPAMSIDMPKETRQRYKRPTLSDYLSQGKTAAQFYAETGQQSTLDSIRSNPRMSFDDKSGAVGEVGTGSHPSDKRGAYDDSGRQMSVGPRQGVTNAIRAAAAGQTYVSPSGNRIPNYTPAGANMTDASTGLPVVAQNRRTSTSFNPFKAVYNKVKKWF